MNKLALSFTLVLLLSMLGNTQVHSEEANKATFIQLIGEDSTSLVITDVLYEFYINDELIYKVSFLTSPWDNLITVLDEHNFFSNPLNEEDPHTIIEVSYNGRHNMQSINHTNIAIDPIVDHFNKIEAKVTGMYHREEVWPVDMAVSIMESYPEQYGVETVILRGNDFLDYVHIENATLIVSDGNPFLNDTKILHTSSMVISIGSGRVSQKISFDTFSVGVDYRPDDLHLTILMDNGIYLYDNLGNQDDSIIGFEKDFDVMIHIDYPNTEPFDLPFQNIWFIALVSISIVYRKRNG
ncbi:MAG: hypothetical protein INQ03_13800 [Candidatus Heimdallarchaeota archaeon]|nr:hypothetical protein [Candidatus Heimdallarchaeota archaeon]